ncbi:apical endosomal glycoprotein [Tiliqua scincoides]|uniref:apical endosomal glycoprotein n=1 Tax=Tiliqua scincoides TaxID=71010 RepID=UPI0034620D8D
MWLFDLPVCLLAGPSLLVQAVFVNRCRTPDVCNFVCDCWDCSDENQCGYQKDSEISGTPFTCDFEGSSCGWEDISTTTYQWIPSRASVSTWGAEPPFDHTRGTDQGWYLITTKQRVKPSATAKLRSPSMQEAAATCEIRAWYHLWGPGLNDTHFPTLTVELTHGKNTVTLWRNPPSSVYPWRELVAYTGRIQGMFQITFSVTQAFSETVQLALDDVEFRNCGFLPSRPCGPGETPCSLGGCVATDRVCDGTRDCKDGSDEASCTAFNICSFENGWCGWADELKDFPWVRNASLQLAPHHAQPTRDHSTNTQAGSFVFVNSGPLTLHGGKAWLVSPTLLLNGSCHLVLYIHLFDSDTNSLNIYYQTEGNAPQLVRSRSGDLGDFWFREKVDFSLTKEEEFRIVIEGVIGAGRKGSIALDDLTLSPGCMETNSTFPVPPDSSGPGLCGPDRFACSDESCISAELACDFKVDCSDGSDEQHCGATSFVDGTGGWMDISVGRLEWAVGRDNSRLNVAGSFFSLREAPGQMLSPAKAATPVLGPSGLACTLEMDFTIGPQGLLILAVADERLGTRRLVWYELGGGPSAQKQARVPLGARDRPFQLELLALDSLTGSGKALLAIRNISFANCDASATQVLPSELSCNFERGWCAWFIEQDDGFEWERRTSRGRDADHTTGSGSFLSADPLVPGPEGLSARLVSSPQVSNGTTCLSFWYRMDGPQIGTLNLKVKHPGEEEQLLWTRRGSYGAVWHRGLSTLVHQSDQHYQVIFEALRDGFLGTMALDDISVTPGACAAQKECSFEADNCGLEMGKQDAWVRRNGAGGQGPPTDHTLGTPAGHYVIINTSSSALPAGRKGSLQSQVFLPLRHTHCVTFWYQLSDSDPGSLRAYVKEGAAPREMLRVGPVQGAAWRRSSFEVEVRQAWQVLFVAESAGMSPSSYVALDDLHVTEGACPGPGSCDFETGTCGWSKPHGDWYGWDWKEGLTPTQSPFPKVDHTLGTNAGHYAYVDIAVLAMGRTAARLVSEPLPATTGSCLHFYYNMNFFGQSSQAELQVKLSSLEGERRMWSATGDQGRGWRHQSLFVTSLTEFQIVLEASRGVWANSETIAVDDVLYVAGTSCSATEGGQEGGPEEGGSSSSGSVAGLVVGVVFSILLGLLGAAIGVYCLKKRRAAGGGVPEISSSQGFDNITFRDDRVIIPPMPSEEEM